MALVSIDGEIVRLFSAKNGPGDFFPDQAFRPSQRESANSYPEITAFPILDNFSSSYIGAVLEPDEVEIGPSVDPKF